jgi:predicted alpha/beta hydrolase
VLKHSTPDTGVMPDLTLAARDGIKLAATFFEPASPNGIAVLVNSGTGIPRQYYGAFAQHLSERGFAVLTYDYRGIGQSEKPDTATMEQWGGIDQPSMIDHLASLAPGAARTVVGHSFGGQVLGLADNIGELSAAVLVCTQSGGCACWRCGGFSFPASPRLPAASPARGSAPPISRRTWRGAGRAGAARRIMFATPKVDRCDHSIATSPFRCAG